MKKITLRDYQTEAIEAVIKAHQENINRQLIALPTGAGKTIIMAAIARHYNKRVLILAHREELIIQARDKFKHVWPSANIGICKAQSKQYNNQIIIGSVQSCSQQKRLEKLKQQNFDILMIDEAHHVPATLYQKIIDVLGFKSGNKLFIGVTATPERSDKRQLGDTFEKIVYTKTIGELIKAEYLAPVIGRKILTNISLKGVHTYSGDFNIQELSEAVNIPERNEFIVDKFIEHAHNRKTIAFCTDVQHCKDLAHAFNKRNVKAAPVWGDMPPKKRSQILKQFKQGKIHILTSCGILTEGYDEASVTAICMARPTKSKSLYIQMIGRGLRTHPNKQNLLVLDFTDKSNNLNSIISLNTTIPEATVVTERKKQQVPIKKPRIKSDINIDQEFDIVGQMQFLWIDIGNGEWSLADDNRNEIIISPVEDNSLYLANIYYYRNPQPHPVVLNPLPLGLCKNACEEYAHKNLSVNYAQKLSQWKGRKDRPSLAQKEFLRSKNISAISLNFIQADMLIRRIIALENKRRRNVTYRLITPAQEYFLKQHGVDTLGMDKFQAIRQIALIKEATHANIR